MIDEFKPCPFCGKEAWLRRLTIDAERGIVGYAVGCSDLECIGFNAGRDLYDSEEEALAAWNRRPGCEGCRWKNAPNSWSACRYCSRMWLYEDKYEPNDNDEREE